MTTEPPDRKCPTGKVRFRSEADARCRLNEITMAPLKPGRLYSPCGVIYCPKCGGHHLTSRLGKQWKKGKAGRDHRR